MEAEQKSNRSLCDFWSFMPSHTPVCEILNPGRDFSDIFLIAVPVWGIFTLTPQH